MRQGKPYFNHFFFSLVNEYFQCKFFCKYRYICFVFIKNILFDTEKVRYLANLFRPLGLSTI